MKRASRGFGLVELMVALVLGLIVVLGVTQIFLAAKNTYQSQTAAANIQEDARFVLSKMLQEIRMAGMYGCLVSDTTSAQDIGLQLGSPITWDSSSSTLSLMTGDVGTTGGTPDFTLITDCFFTATLSAGNATPAAGQSAFPIRKVVYSWANNQLSTGTGAAKAVLVNNVSAFTVAFGTASSAQNSVAASYVAAPGNATLIRSVRLSMTLTDPNGLARDQTFNVVATIRNRVQ